LNAGQHEPPSRADPPANSFLQRAQPVWDELESLLASARRKGVRNLSADDIARLDKLYRLTTAHLAQVQSRASRPELAHRLNRLVGRAHAFLYVAPRRNPIKRVFAFYLTGYPRLIARTWGYHAAAILLLLAGAVLAYHATRTDPFAAYALSTAGDIRLPGASREQLEQVLLSGRDSSAAEKSGFSSFLFVHNTKVGLTAFAGGLLLGLPTVYLLLATGAMLGNFTAIHAQRGLGVEMAAWILPHGITEIFAACLGAGAGLMLARGLLLPGASTRWAALRREARRALGILAGIAPMFVAAGYIEGVLRQSHMPNSERLVFAGATAVFWALYIGAGFVLEARDRARERKGPKTHAARVEPATADSPL
jgi:uncharacterized membrane protein SpoIIM required for sporulation